MSPRVQFLLGFWKGRSPTLCPSYCSAPHWSRTVKHTGKCLLFVYFGCMCPRFTWTPKVSIFELLVCQLIGFSPYIHQNWYQRSKDHCHSEKNCTLGIHWDPGVPTEIFQHPCDTHTHTHIYIYIYIGINHATRSTVYVFDTYH